jgi:hypothetical protein
MSEPDSELKNVVATHVGSDAVAYLLAVCPDPEAFREEAQRYLRRLADRVKGISPRDVRLPHIAKRSQAIRADLERLTKSNGDDQ